MGASALGVFVSWTKTQVTVNYVAYLLATGGPLTSRLHYCANGNKFHALLRYNHYVTVWPRKLSEVARPFFPRVGVGSGKETRAGEVGAVWFTRLLQPKVATMFSAV